ncbi:MAG: hypothetical protein ACLR2O_02755 [Coprococcus sp.]
MRDGGRRDDRRKSSHVYSGTCNRRTETKPPNKPKMAHKKKEYNRNEENEDRLQKGKKGKNNNAQPKMVKPQPKKEVVEERDQADHNSGSTYNPGTCRCNEDPAIRNR